MKNTKNIFLIIIIILLIIIIAGIYKFNYLSSKKGYDVDGNKITQLEQKNKELNKKIGKDTENKNNSYFEKRKNELEKMGIKIINSEDEFGNSVKETLYSHTFSENPLSNVSLSARKYWFSWFVGMNQNEISEKYLGFEDEDFKNTGNLKEQFDYDILLNNILKRVELEPHNDEHIETLIDDLKNNTFLSESEKKEMMLVKVPNVKWSDIEDREVTIFVEYYVPKNTKVLNAVYKKLFNVRSSYGDGIWNGLNFDSVAIQDGVAQIQLSGSWYPVGDMSGYYFSRLINAAAFQYDTVNKVEVFVNNALFDWCIDDESEGEGGCSENPRFWSISRMEYNEAWYNNSEI